MRSTIKHIAELAGVSKTTVSFAFNDPAKISRETYEKIMEIADREGYVPDPIARTMTTKRVGTIGVLLPQAIQEAFRNPYVAEVLRGIGMVCHQEDLFMTVLPPVKGYLSQAIRNAAVDGFIALGLETAADITELIRQRRVPFVAIDGDPDSGVINVGIDDTQAAESVMDHILSLGHRKIIILSLKSEGPVPTEEFSSRTVNRRLDGFKRSLGLFGRSLEASDIRIIPVEATVEAARDAVFPVLVQEPPTAVVCMGDVAAFGVYEACRNAGLSIPDDISVTGMDDIPFASLIDPPLTTVRQPGIRKGTYAARSIIDMIQGRPAASVVLPTDLLVRSSTARVPL